jgi:NAD(P)-dependent dehydrogenase (short-subunit alcohol dehydrogenase family)
LADLRDLVALVTGAAGGLGGGISTALAERGATVVCADLRDAAGVATALPEGRGHSVTLDVTDSSEVDRTVEHIVGSYGRLDVLVNNAGIAQPPAPVVETTDQTLNRVLDVNVKGVFFCARAAARVMSRQGSGRIINIASQAGKNGVPEWAVYSASKAAVVAMTQSLARELASYSVTVNCICPGAMLTSMTTESIRAEAEAKGIDGDELFATLNDRIPLGRLGTPEDIGAMVAWIASDESAFTTGASFNLTGGESVFF